MITKKTFHYKSGHRASFAKSHPKNSKLITTAIEYPNGSPHIGHAYEKILADALARFHRLKGEAVTLTLGLDEHSQKVVLEAQKVGKTPADYCSDIAAFYKETWKKIGVGENKFIRTSNPNHHHLVQKAIQKIFDKGDIEFRQSQVFTCASCDEPKKEFEVKDGKCRTHGLAVSLRSESGYFFRTTRYKDRLRELLEENSGFIFPHRYASDVLNFLNQHLEDFYISRPGIWGVPFPACGGHQSHSQVVYVWFDALLNYLTASGYGFGEPAQAHAWPAHTQVIGRDIVNFHGLLWPAILLSLDLPLPRRLLVHSFVNFGNEKVSKSSGHGKETIEKGLAHGADGLRYYLLREFSLSKDKAFDASRLAHVVKVELDSKVNFFIKKLAQELSLARSVPSATLSFSPIEPDPEFTHWLGKYQAYFEADEITEGLAALYQLFQVQSRLLHQLRGLQGNEKERALRVLAEQERLKALWAWPVIPHTCERILSTLGIDQGVLSKDPRVNPIWQPDTVR